MSVATVNPLRISHALSIISKLLLLNTCGFDRTQCTAPLSLLFIYLINSLYVVELCPNPVFFTEQLRTSKGLFLNHVMNLYPLRVLPIALIQGHFHRFFKIKTYAITQYWNFRLIGMQYFWCLVIISENIAWYSNFIIHVIVLMHVK